MVACAVKSINTFRVAWFWRGTEKSRALQTVQEKVVTSWWKGVEAKLQVGLFEIGLTRGVVRTMQSVRRRSSEKITMAKLLNMQSVGHNSTNSLQNTLIDLFLGNSNYSQTSKQNLVKIWIICKAEFWSQKWKKCTINLHNILINGRSSITDIREKALFLNRANENLLKMLFTFVSNKMIVAKRWNPIQMFSDMSSLVQAAS